AATLVNSPLVKVLIGYAIAGAVGAVGWLMRRHSETAGRATVAISAALAFFVSFAGHWIEPMRLFGPWVSVILMFASSVVLVRLAEECRPDAAAATGFGLRVVAALLSARAGEGLALRALVNLCGAAGALWMRNGWGRLTAFVLLGASLGTALLWYIL